MERADGNAPIRQSKTVALQAQLLLCVVSAFNQQLIIVVDVGKYGGTEEGWNDFHAVVIGLCVIDWRFFTVYDGFHHGHNVAGQCTGVLKDGHGLQAGQNVLGVGDIAVLTVI